jgi:2'-5' RNA ligase
LHNTYIKVDINIIRAELEDIAARTRPFTLILDGIRYWEGSNNVAYVAVKNKVPVFNLHVAVTHSLHGLVAGNDIYDLENFMPHLTISENIPGDTLSTIKQ